MQANLGIAEAALRSARAFLYETLEKAWETVSAGQALGIEQRAMLWLASTHTATAAKQAAELMFSAGGSASPGGGPNGAIGAVVQEVRIGRRGEPLTQ